MIGKKVNLEKSTFYLLLLLWLLPVWAVSVVLTGDGPCHLYNSRILLDWLQGNNLDMYSHFIKVNTYINPNWLTNLIQIPLLALFSPIIAEKIFYTFYLLGFAFGFRFLIRQINPKALYLCSMGLIFAWHHIVFKGFSNYTWSIAVWFWAVGCWLKYRNASFGKAVGVQLTMALVGYFAHPVGFAFTVIMIACLLLTETITLWYETKSNAAVRKFLFKQVFRLFIAYIPALILVIIFIARRTWTEETAGYNSEVWKNFITMPALVALNRREEIFAIITSLFCFLLLGISLYLRIKEKGIQRNDGFLVFLIVSFLLIIFPPASIMGGFDVPRRLVMLPLLAILFFAATRTTCKRFQVATLIIGCSISIAFLIIRLPLQRESAAFAQEIISCKDKIAPRSTVLTLNYDPDPHNLKGESIIDMEWTNVHTDCYLGAFKPLMIADNYELNTDFFPLRGIGENSLYYQSVKDGKMIDDVFPLADFNGYKDKTDFKVDYVIVYGLREDQQNHDHTKDVMMQLEQGFEKIYTSAHGVAVLYRNKSSFKNPWVK